MANSTLTPRAPGAAIATKRCAVGNFNCLTSFKNFTIGTNWLEDCSTNLDDHMAKTLDKSQIVNLLNNIAFMTDHLDMWSVDEILQHRIFLSNTRGKTLTCRIEGFKIVAPSAFDGGIVSFIEESTGDEMTMSCLGYVDPRKMLTKKQ